MLAVVLAVVLALVVDPSFPPNFPVAYEETGAIENPSLGEKGMSVTITIPVGTSAGDAE